MKFLKVMSALLGEGRKEDLQKKYSDKFNEYSETLSTILNSSDLSDTNFKYADFVLKNLHPNSSLDEVAEVIELVKDFHRYQSNLEKKDINQYKSIDELNRALNFSKTKEEEKQLSSQSQKVYEDDKFLVVKPQTEEASCKYGSNTRWCVTSKGSGHFGRYTSGKQGLYFIINKSNSTNQNYSKVAIHFDDEGYLRYWDARDSLMTRREVDVMEYAFPEIIQSIKDDYKKISISTRDIFLQKIFSNHNEKLIIYKNYLSSGFSLEVSVVGFYSGDTEKGYATASLVIRLVSPDGEETIIDAYKTYIIYNQPNEMYFDFKVSFVGDDELTRQDIIDLGLENFEFGGASPIGSSINITSDNIRGYILNRVLDRIQDNPNLIQKVAGTSKVWRPDRGNYGYTFSQNKGLIKKLVDYMDDGTIGTKLDFLVSIGKLKSKIIDGKKYYSKNGDFLPSSNWRGHFSSFFASAKMAGILNYRKVGRDYFLTKGPNFNAFKEGQLKPL
jgi:hypothetical protein